MIVKKNPILVVMSLVSSLPVVIYLVNVRWGGGDAGSYILGFRSFLESFQLDSYSLSGALFSPFLILAGSNPDSLIYSSVLYRIAFSCALPRFESPLLRITLISFLLFPLHTLLSLFPGKDVFSYGFFILLLYSVLRNKPAFLFYLFSALSGLFRPPLGLFLLMACLSYSLCRFFLSRFHLPRGIVLPATVLLVLTSSALLIPLMPGMALSDVQERISIELDAGYFNIVGYTEFPWTLLNLFFPLFSSNPVSFYSLLSLENLICLFFVVSFLGSSDNSYRHYLAFKILCVFVVMYALFFSCLWPNVTDAARKIYPFTLCGAASVFLLHDRRANHFRSMC